MKNFHLNILYYFLLAGFILKYSVADAAFKKKIVFTYNSAADSRLEKELKVNKVSITGTFNGWNKDADIMESSSSGFRKTIELPEGVHYYKFVVNDNIWLEDMTADSSLRRDDGMGHNEYNSGVRVKETGSDYGKAEKNSIVLRAVKHDYTERYYKVIKPQEIKIILRTLKDDTGKVDVIYYDGKENRQQTLNPAGSSDGFDFYETVLNLTSGKAYFTYYFKLYDGKYNIEYKYPGDKPFEGFTGIVADVPGWARGTIWYQIFPERFRNGDTSNGPEINDIQEGDLRGWRIKDWGSDWYEMDEWEKNISKEVFQTIYKRRYGGDLQGIIDKMDYLEELGINAIYLNPVFRSPSLHKYDGACFHHIEETFGPDPEGDRKLIQHAGETEDPSTWVWTKADRLFLDFIKKAHSKGIRVIIDGVFNHSGRLFFAFQDILKNKKESKYIGWYEITEWDDKLSDGFAYRGWFGHQSLPEFKRDENNVAGGYKEYVFNITKRWMAPDGKTKDGVDGWRLDVAYCLPHGFWKDWRRHVKKINPGAYITAEIVEIDPTYLQGDEFDALMNYPFAYTVTEFFIDKKNKITAGEFDKRLKEIRNAYPEDMTFVMQNLISSHDTARAATLINNPDMNYRDFGGHFGRSSVEQNNSYRIDRGGKETPAIHKLIAIFQMTYIGAPMIYYGDEVGMTGATDPDCRKPMLWNDIKYSDETVHPVKGYTLPRRKNRVDKDLLEHYKKLTKIRNSHPALKLGKYKTVYTDDKNDVFGFVREYKDESIMIVINNSSKKQKVKLAFHIINKNYFNDLLDSGKKYEIKNNCLNLSVKPRWAVILK